MKHYITMKQYFELNIAYELCIYYLFPVSEDEAEIVEDLRVNGEEATTNYTTGM